MVPDSSWRVKAKHTCPAGSLERYHLNVTNTGATNLLRQLEGVGIVKPMARIPGRSNRWVAHEVMAALREDTTETE